MIKDKTMVEVEEMNDEDSKKLLGRIGYGHLGMVRDTHPYVVPVNYAYDDLHLYIYTTEGKKTEIIDGNQEVCLQVEEVTDKQHWQSVIVLGDAVQLTEKKGIARAMKFIRATNPSLTPALSIHWMDAWVRSNHQVVYRITPTTITGRETVNRSAVPISSQV